MTVNNIRDLAEVYLGIDVSSLKRAIYKNTDCGAWIEWDDAKITIGSIVEGSDAEFAKALFFPFKSDVFDAWIEELERLTDEAWKEANLE